MVEPPSPATSASSVREVRTYSDVQQLLRMYGATKSEAQRMIGVLAGARGLDRLTKKNLDAFFGP